MKGTPMSELKERVLTVYEEMVAWRRHLHEHPELSFEEYETAAYIRSVLETFGLDEIRVMEKTATIGILRGTAGPGPCIALRADIDALPVFEKTGYPFCSKKEGLMHACGHDGHVAMLLGACKILCERKAQLRGTVKFIFQNGEERFPGGALRLVEEGILEDPHVDLILGAHLVPHETSGVIRVKEGPVSIGCDLVDVTVHGKSGHASNPQLAHDALLAACQYVVAIQQIVSRSVRPRDTAIISVGTLRSGTAVNIVADRAELSLNARTYDPDVRAIVHRRLKEIAEGIGIATNCTFDVETTGGVPPVINQKEAVDLLTDACRKHFGEDSVDHEDYDLGSDDFSYYNTGTGVPGAYFFVLAGYEGDELYANHHPKFSWKEDAMKAGTQAYVAAVTEYLK